MKYIIKKIIFLGLFPILIGIVSSFSLPPYDFYFINFFTYPILFLVLISINKDKKLISFIFGWMFGFGYFLSSLYWIANALTFDEIFKPLIPLAVIIIPLFLGIFYGFATFFASIFKLKKNISSILLFSLTVAIIEFVRGYVLGGFPWNLIVYSLTNYLYSIQILSFIIIFLIFNFFSQSFLGDNGSYLLGFFVGFYLISFYINQNNIISPYYIIVLLWYPAYENLFSIMRRLFFERKKVKRADNLHLHHLVYKFLSKQNGTVLCLLYLHKCKELVVTL